MQQAVHLVSETRLVNSSFVETIWRTQSDRAGALTSIVFSPVVVGKGKRLFKEGIPTTLKLLESQPFGSGVVALVY